MEYVGPSCSLKSSGSEVIGERLFELKNHNKPGCYARPVSSIGKRILIHACFRGSSLRAYDT